MPYLEALARFLDRDGNVLRPDDWQSPDPRAMSLARSESPRIVQQHRQTNLRFGQLQVRQFACNQASAGEITPKRQSAG
jgi:hypothetical protein